MYRTVEEQSHDYMDSLIDERENIVEFTAEFISPVRDPTRYATLKPTLLNHLETASNETLLRESYEAPKVEKPKLTTLTFCRRLVSVLKKL